MLKLPVIANAIQRAPIPGTVVDQTTDQAFLKTQRLLNGLATDLANLAASAGALTLRSVTTDAFAALTDALIVCNAAAPMTLTLPDATTATGKVLIAKRLNALVTIASRGGTIDGATTVTLGSANSVKQLVSDGHNWLILAAYL